MNEKSVPVIPSQNALDDKKYSEGVFPDELDFLLFLRVQGKMKCKVKSFLNGGE